MMGCKMFTDLNCDCEYCKADIEHAQHQKQTLSTLKGFMKTESSQEAVYAAMDLIKNQRAYIKRLDAAYTEACEQLAENMESINELVEMLEDVIIWTNESIYHDEVIMEAQLLGAEKMNEINRT